MEYKLFTMPHCDKCHKIKDMLNEKSVSFEEVDLGEDQGVAMLRKFYVQIKDKIERTNDGQLPVPLFISFEEDNVKDVLNSIEDIKKLFD